MIAQVMTLVEAAHLLYPYERGKSAYDRLYRYITRNERRCPVRFTYGKSSRCGRKVRYIDAADLPALKRFVEGKD